MRHCYETVAGATYNLTMVVLDDSNGKLKRNGYYNYPGSSGQRWNFGTARCNLLAGVICLFLMLYASVPFVALYRFR